jgi:hypothetical protein
MAFAGKVNGNGSDSREGECALRGGGNGNGRTPGMRMGFAGVGSRTPARGG